MGTKDENMEIHIEDGEVLEDLGEGNHPRGILPTACKHHLISLVGDVEFLIFGEIVLRGRRKEKHPWVILVTLIRFMQLFTTTRKNINPS